VFVRALEAKDVYTARHTERVAKYAVYIGEELGLRGARLRHLRNAALMHDIGKLAVPRELLNKPGPLTPDEYDEVRRHNQVCVQILSRVAFLRSTIVVATDQHGHFAASDAAGHPEVLEGWIVAVADAFDAMTSTRAYRRALSQPVAFAELRQGSGTQFHPGSVAALIKVIERRGEIYGAGYEVDPIGFAFEPPAAGVGSAGLGHLDLSRAEAELAQTSLPREADPESGRVSGGDQDADLDQVGEPDAGSEDGPPSRSRPAAGLTPFRPPHRRR
jgi:putative nucleotidyltransferase with HDIG domain